MPEASPEQIAYQLMQDIARVERKLLYQSDDPQGFTLADRQWILETYAACLAVVRDGRPPAERAARTAAGPRRRPAGSDG